MGDVPVIHCNNASNCSGVITVSELRGSEEGYRGGEIPKENATKGGKSLEKRR
jgi:hypothetical protein